MNNVVLVGFMGAGKSTVGRVLADRLQRPFVDLDDRIAAAAGKEVSAIFEQEGEAGFRRRESAQLSVVLATSDQVVAVGGGTPMSPQNWERLREGNCVVALTATPATLRTRLNGAGERPLLRNGLDAALTSLLPARMGRYLEADLVVGTDGQDARTVAGQVAAALPVGGLRHVPVAVPGAAHEIVIGRGLSHLAAPALARSGAEGIVALVSDETVARLHAPALDAALVSAGWRVRRHVLPAGEAAKDLEQVGALYAFLAHSGVDRQGALVALGGGSVGDVAGYAAATWLRGVPYLQMPTTLLAMVDSSIGGKTGVNLPAGKNLVGAVHQPIGILADLTSLDTLPVPQYRAAWGEIIKSAIIGDASLFDRLRATRSQLMARDPVLLPEVIARTCALKAQIVAEDPLERGTRAILNYGHTVGHALEAAAGYGRLLHGDAVAWGMRVAARLSRRLGLCGDEVVEAQDTLLRDYGLPAPLPAFSRAQLGEAMGHDKKTRGRELRWVLLRGIGRAESGLRVAPHELTAVLDELL